jgi:hypothetical protein
VVCGWWEVEVGGKNGREEIFMAVTLPMHADTVLDLKRFADVFGQSVESVRVGPSDQVEDMRCAQRCHHFPEGRVTQDTTEFCFGFLQVGGKKKKKEWGISLQWQFLLLLPAGWAGWLGLVTHEKAEKDRTGSGWRNRTHNEKGPHFQRAIGRITRVFELMVLSLFCFVTGLVMGLVSVVLTVVWRDCLITALCFIYRKRNCVVSTFAEQI